MGDDNLTPDECELFEKRLSAFKEWPDAQLMHMLRTTNVKLQAIMAAAEAKGLIDYLFPAGWRL